MTFLRNLIQDLDATSRTALQILLLLAGVGIVTSAVSTAIDSNSFWAWLDGFTQNFATEMIGAVVTFVLFELFVRKQQERVEALENEKDDLVVQMRSKDNATALNAVTRLHALGGVRGTSLKGGNLRGANLNGANLWRANLQDADLRFINLHSSNLKDANLRGVDLKSANLQGADLSGANLQGAILMEANLQDAQLVLANFNGANLSNANLQGAQLVLANLHGANLRNTNLQGVDLWISLCGKETQLPDSTDDNPVYWTPDTDMTRYTDPDHPDFWQPDWVKEQADNS